MTSEYPEFVFVAYDGDMTTEDYDISVSLEAGSLVGKPVKYIRHDSNTRAAPDVPELVRWKHCEYPNQHKMIEHKDGEYVLHSQAAEIIAAKDVEIAGIKDCVKGLFDDRAYNRERAAAAEAKLAQYEAQESSHDKG